MARFGFRFSAAPALVFLGTTSVALADCYVDSQGGNDSNGGASEDEAVDGEKGVPVGQP